MKKNVSILFLLVLMFSIKVSYAQNVVRFYSEFQKHQLLEGLASRYVKVEGTPYMSDEFINGDVLVISDQPYIYKAYLRYNMYTDEMEFKDDTNQVYLLTPPKGMKEINLKGQTYIYSAYKHEGDNIQKGYFILLNEGNYKLLKKKKVVLLEAEREEPYKPARPAWFHQESDKFFVKKGDSPAIFIKKAKHLKSIFPEKKDLITNYIKSNKVRMRDIDSMINLFEYINEN